MRTFHGYREVVLTTTRRGRRQYVQYLDTGQFGWVHMDRLRYVEEETK